MKFIAPLAKSSKLEIPQPLVWVPGWLCYSLRSICVRHAALNHFQSDVGVEKNRHEAFIEFEDGERSNVICISVNVIPTGVKGIMGPG